jgi:hypothetical protein
MKSDKSLLGPPVKATPVNRVRHPEQLLLECMPAFGNRARDRNNERYAFSDHLVEDRIDPSDIGCSEEPVLIVQAIRFKAGVGYSDNALFVQLHVTSMGTSLIGRKRWLLRESWPSW